MALSWHAQQAVTRQTISHRPTASSQLTVCCAASHIYRNWGSTTVAAASSMSDPEAASTAIHDTTLATTGAPQPPVAGANGQDCGGSTGQGPAVTLEQLRCDLRVFCEEREWQQFHTPRNLLLALTGEVGELAEIFQWRGEVAPGLPDFTPAERVHAAEELSDVLLYLVRLADVCGVELGQAALDKMRKNALKYPANKCKGSSAKYTAYHQQEQQGLQQDHSEQQHGQQQAASQEQQRREQQLREQQQQQAVSKEQE